MTTVIIRKTADGIYKGFTCMGHSGYAEKGEDIVCASISALVINAINSIGELAGDEMEVTAEEETGFIDCRFRHTPSGGGRLLMDSMILGLSGISGQYGREYLILNFEEV